jgi:hypothetical protein
MDAATTIMDTVTDLIVTEACAKPGMARGHITAARPVVGIPITATGAVISRSGR